MKKIFFIGTMLLCSLMIFTTNAEAQSRKEKKAAKKAAWVHQQKLDSINRQRELDSAMNVILCKAYGKSDKEYFRQVGIGEDLDLSLAQKKALQAAKSLVRDRLGEQVKGLVSDYTKTYSKTNKGADLEGILEREFTAIVDDALNNADNPCEQHTQINTGAYRYFYAIEISKSKLVDGMAGVIDNNEKLRAEFDRDQFRKWAKEYLKDLKSEQ